MLLSAQHLIMEEWYSLNGSASATQLKAADRAPPRALRPRNGARSSSPGLSLQVEHGEEPLVLRGEKLALAYTVNLGGHERELITQTILENSFGLGGWMEHRLLGAGDGTQKRDDCPNREKLSPVPPWLFHNWQLIWQLRNTSMGSRGRVSGWVMSHTRNIYYSDWHRNPHHWWIRIQRQGEQELPWRSEAWESASSGGSCSFSLFSDLLGLVVYSHSGHAELIYWFKCICT